MDCCNYGEWRTRAGYGSSWEGYGSYAPLPYSAYAAPPYYTPPGPEYARYAATAAAAYYYDYPAASHHVSHNEHIMATDYGSYASKEMRARRSMARRESLRSRTPVQHLLPATTPPLECGLTGRGSYYDPQMWQSYQMGPSNGWSSSSSNASWASRSMQIRYPEFRAIKSPSTYALNQMTYAQDCKSSYPMYEDSSSFASESDTNLRHHSSGSVTGSSASGTPPRQDNGRAHRPASMKVEARPTPPPPLPQIIEKRAPIVPLPAFQQAFGSTEIGKFAEAFARTEMSLEENFSYEQFSEWEQSSTEPQWSSTSAPREIKCEESF